MQDDAQWKAVMEEGRMLLLLPDGMVGRKIWGLKSGHAHRMDDGWWTKGEERHNDGLRRKHDRK